MDCATMESIVTIVKILMGGIVGGLALIIILLKM